MNGFHLLNKYDIQSYLDVLSQAKPYQDDEGVCIDIVFKDADITLMFLKPMELPGKDVLTDLLKTIVELDYFIASRESFKEAYIKDGCEYQFSYAEIDDSNELTMFYCGVDVNTQWGAIFLKNDSGNWEFQSLCLC